MGFADVFLLMGWLLGEPFDIVEVDGGYITKET
jgi:hypothetical protein